MEQRKLSLYKSKTSFYHHLDHTFTLLYFFVVFLYIIQKNIRKYGQQMPETHQPNMVMQTWKRWAKDVAKRKQRGTRTDHKKLESNHMKPDIGMLLRELGETRKCLKLNMIIHIQKSMATMLGQNQGKSWMEYNSNPK
jgi:hypothetical protein